MLHIIIACVIVVDTIVGGFSLVLPYAFKIEFIFQVGDMETICSLVGRVRRWSRYWVKCPLLSILVIYKGIVLGAVEQLKGSCIVLVTIWALVDCPMDENI